MKTRRDFIKISTVGTGGLALGLSSLNLARGNQAQNFPDRKISGGPDLQKR